MSEKGEGKKLEEETSRFMAARATEMRDNGVDSKMGKKKLQHRHRLEVEI